MNNNRWYGLTKKEYEDRMFELHFIIAKEWNGGDDMTEEMMGLAEKLAHRCQLSSKLFVNEEEAKSLHFIAERLRAEIQFPYMVEDFKSMTIFTKNILKSITDNEVQNYIKKVLDECDSCLDEYRKAGCTLEERQNLQIK